MNADREQHWENIYHSKSPGEVSWYQATPETSLRLINFCNPDSLTAIIDVGGGASQLVDSLVAAGHLHVAVLDISKTALDIARQRLDKNSQSVEWFVSDVTKFRSPHPYGIWHDRAVFHFLTESQDRKKYVQAVEKTIPVSGHVIIGAFAIDGPTQCSGLDIVQYDADKLLAEFGNSFSLVHQESEQHHTPADKIQLFNWFVLQRNTSF